MRSRSGYSSIRSPFAFLHPKDSLKDCVNEQLIAICALTPCGGREHDWANVKQTWERLLVSAQITMDNKRGHFSAMLTAIDDGHRLQIVAIVDVHAICQQSMILQWNRIQ